MAAGGSVLWLALAVRVLSRRDKAALAFVPRLVADFTRSIAGGIATEAITARAAGAIVRVDAAHRAGRLCFSAGLSAGLRAGSGSGPGLRWGVCLASLRASPGLRRGVCLASLRAGPGPGVHGNVLCPLGGAGEVEVVDAEDLVAAAEGSGHQC